MKRITASLQGELYEVLENKIRSTRQTLWNTSKRWWRVWWEHIGARDVVQST